MSAGCFVLTSGAGLLVALPQALYPVPALPLPQGWAGVPASVQQPATLPGVLGM